MAQLFFKEFSDIAVSSGQPKLTMIRKEKHKPPYQPAGDYYKQLREAIVEAHEQSLGQVHITSEANGCPNPKRKGNYIALANAYNKWWGKKAITSHPHQKDTFSANGIDITLNPELCLEWSGHKHLVKLYFNQEAMTQARANYMIHLMDVVYSGRGINEFNVLDIKKGKLFSFTGSAANFTIGLSAETAFIAAAWPSL